MILVPPSIREPLVATRRLAGTLWRAAYASSTRSQSCASSIPLAAQPGSQPKSMMTISCSVSPILASAVPNLAASRLPSFKLSGCRSVWASSATLLLSDAFRCRCMPKRHGRRDRCGLRNGFCTCGRREPVLRQAFRGRGAFRPL